MKSNVIFLGQHITINEINWTKIIIFVLVSGLMGNLGNMQDMMKNMPPGAIEDAIKNLTPEKINQALDNPQMQKMMESMGKIQIPC